MIHSLHLLLCTVLLVAVPATAQITLTFEDIPAQQRPYDFYNGGSTLADAGQTPVTGPNLGITVRDRAYITRQIQATPNGFIGSTYVPTPPSGVNVLNFAGVSSSDPNKATFNVAAGFTDEISVWWFGGAPGGIAVYQDEGGSVGQNVALGSVATAVNSTSGCVFDFNALTVTGCGWTKYTVTFTGTARSVVLGGLGVYDDLTFGAASAPPPVGGVPEPASWAMLIAGFGLVGAIQRRRRVTLAASTAALVRIF